MGQNSFLMYVFIESMLDSYNCINTSCILMLKKSHAKKLILMDTYSNHTLLNTLSRYWALFRNFGMNEITIGKSENTPVWCLLGIYILNRCDIWSSVCTNIHLNIDITYIAWYMLYQHFDVYLYKWHPIVIWVLEGGRWNDFTNHATLEVASLRCLRKEFMSTISPGHIP